MKPISSACPPWAATSWWHSTERNPEPKINKEEPREVKNKVRKSQDEVPEHTETNRSGDKWSDTQLSGGWENAVRSRKGSSAWWRSFARLSWWRRWDGPEGRSACYQTWQAGFDPRTHMAGGDNWFLHVILWSPQVCHDMHPYIYTHR